MSEYSEQAYKLKDRWEYCRECIKLSEKNIIQYKKNIANAEEEILIRKKQIAECQAIGKFLLSNDPEILTKPKLGIFKDVQ